MNFASYIISICLHVAVLLLFWFWPASAPLRLDTPPVMISLVDGAPGGNRTPSPILGHMGEPADGPLAPTPPAPKSEVAAPAREEIKTPEPVAQAVKDEVPVQKPELKPEPKPLPKPAEDLVAAKKEDKPKPEPKPEPKEEKKKEPVAKPKEKEKPKEEKKKDKEKPKDTPKDKDKDKPKKKEKPVDPVAAALQQAKRKASSRAESGDRGNAIEQALAQAKRNAGGNRGGGGGEGDGPGGGGLGDVYMGQVMLAVRPNWGFASASRANLSCVVRVVVDLTGKVLQTAISQSSGNAQYDASAVNAVIRTSQAGQFPPPPSQEYTELDLVFTYNELMGR